MALKKPSFSQIRSKTKAAGSRAQVAAEHLRDRILNGQYASGSQLPTFDDLVEEFRISRATMQLTIRQLKEEGFVRSVHRSGLFVSETPPHRHRFGLVFSAAPGEPEWNRFMAALQAEAPVVLRHRSKMQIVPFYHVNEGTPEALHHLLSEVAIHRLAGLILTKGTAFLLDSPVVVQSGIPCAAINHLPHQAPGVPVVNTDEPRFYKKALAWLAKRGRQRVAVLAGRQFVGLKEEDCVDAGLKTLPQWLCPVGLDFAGQTRSVTRLLLDYPRDKRPDAIILATDHLVEEALGAIHESGVVIGRDLDVVAHCNWPWPVESPLPIARLGFHSHDFLNVSLDLISAIRSGEQPSPHTLVPALFEHEVRRELLKHDSDDYLALSDLRFAQNGRFFSQSFGR